MDVLAKGKLLTPIMFGIASIALVASETSFARGSDSPVELKGGAITFDFLTKKKQSSATENDTGQVLFLNFGFNAASFAGDFSLNGIVDSSTSDFKHKYGDRINATPKGNDVEIYNFSATHIGEKADVNLFYHVPRYHWGYEGDMFGLMPEATDMSGEDVWNAKAPSGLEIVGKDNFDGLKIVVGDEIYWSASQMAMLKYQFGDIKQYTFVASGETNSDRKATQASLQGEFNVGEASKLKVGVLKADDAKVGQSFDYYKNGVAYTDKVSDDDTIAFMTRLTSPINGNTEAYVSYNYAGLVANAGANLEEMGSSLPYSKLGNKQVFELGAKITNGSYMIVPRLMVRKNLVNANPHNIIGIDQRNKEIAKDPFLVMDNRQATAAELFITYDPTPATYFYEWDNDVWEDAPLAYNIGLTYVNYQARSDAKSHYDQQGWWWADKGTVAAGILSIKSRIVVNTEAHNKLIVNLESGYQEEFTIANGDAFYDYTKFYNISGKFIHNQANTFTFDYAKNKVGEYDDDNEWGVKYPDRFELGYERQLDVAKGDGSNNFGVKLFYRSLDADSGIDDYASGANKYMHEVQAYYTQKF